MHRNLKEKLPTDVKEPLLPTKQLEATKKQPSNKPPSSKSGKDALERTEANAGSDNDFREAHDSLKKQPKATPAKTPPLPVSATKSQKVFFKIKKCYFCYNFYYLS